ncbi:hypothetical protein Fcan01_13626 [Folsomia candida]|uniref:Uncharacterized protein n=2 Tax=Folsomia candida TaxID=158441 RepID=A0A226E2P6_FOLCA|nr:hypothetical protein Fcan01_13626 [Folsomia candida]
MQCLIGNPNWLVVAASLTLLLPLGSAQTLSLIPSIEAFSGVYVQEVPTSSIFYTTVSPLVYGFKVPNWSRNETYLPTQNCSLPDWSEGTICPTAFYLARVQSRFSEYLFNGRPLLHRLIEMGATPQVTEIMFDCHTLDRHFKDIYVDKGVMERYLEKLKGCSPAGDTEYFRHISSYTYNISSVYRQMYDSYFNEVWLQVSGGRIDAGLWSNAQSVLNTLNFFNHHVELHRWHSALSDCEAGRIPDSLLTPELIGDSLQELFETLRQSNLVPLIPASDIGNYFRNRLADCTFTNESFVVRVLIPVTAKNQSHSLYSIRPATFYDAFTERYCSLELSNGVFLFDNLNLVAYDTTCTPNDFCHAPKVNTGRVNSCASALLNQDWKDALEFCPFKCHSLNKYHKKSGLHITIASQVMTPDKVLLAGDRPLDTRVGISCLSSSTSWTYSPIFNDSITEMANKSGCLELTLPCGCTLTVENAGVNYTRTCGSQVMESSKTPKLRLVVPFHWLRKQETIASLSKVPTPYVPISMEDLFPSSRPASSSSSTDPTDRTSTPRGGGGGITLVLLVCVFVTIGVCVVVGILVRRLHFLGVNLFTGGSLGKTCPQSVSYQHMEQPEL